MWKQKKGAAFTSKPGTGGSGIKEQRRCTRQVTKQETKGRDVRMRRGKKGKGLRKETGDDDVLVVVTPKSIEESKPKSKKRVGMFGEG